MEWTRSENLPIVVALIPSLAVWGWFARNRGPRAGSASIPEPPWQKRRIEDGVLLFCLVFLAPLLVTAFFGAKDAAEALQPERLALVSVLQAAVVANIAWAFRPRTGKPIPGEGAALPPEPIERLRRRDLYGLAVAWGWAGLAPCFLVNGLVILSGWKPPEESHPLLRMLTEAGGPRFLVLFGVCMAAGLCAPVVEEIQFRHALQGWLSGAWGSRAGLWVTALLFAAAHYSPGRPDAIPILPFALILGWLYARHRSLIANILCHATFNLLNIAIAVAQSVLRGDSTP